MVVYVSLLSTFTFIFISWSICYFSQFVSARVCVVSCEFVIMSFTVLSKWDIPTNPIHQYFFSFYSRIQKTTVSYVLMRTKCEWSIDFLTVWKTWNFEKLIWNIFSSSIFNTEDMSKLIHLLFLLIRKRKLKQNKWLKSRQMNKWSGIIFYDTTGNKDTHWSAIAP